MKSLIKTFVFLSFYLFLQSCTDQPYKDGQWWANEIVKMEQDSTYDFPVSKQFMRVKHMTDDCGKEYQQFIRGFEDFIKKQTKYKQELLNQVNLTKKDCLK